MAFNPMWIPAIISGANMLFGGGRDDGLQSWERDVYAEPYIGNDKAFAPLSSGIENWVPKGGWLSGGAGSEKSGFDWSDPNFWLNAIGSVADFGASWQAGQAQDEQLRYYKKIQREEREKRDRAARRLAPFMQAFLGSGPENG